MRLFDIAVTAVIYERLTEFNQSYGDFLASTEARPELGNKNHMKSLLKWLNRWGCRQFSKEYHSLAAEEILSWYKNAREEALPDFGETLQDVDERTIQSTSESYELLASKIASYREKGSNTFKVSVGPTGASKILFAIRPRSMVAWDEGMRRGLGYDGAGPSYTEFLRRVRDDVAGLKEQCNQAGLEFEEIPKMVGRPLSTLPQLIGEYYYMTKTRGLNPYDFEKMRTFGVQFQDLGA